jgi:hypothetical protein
MVINNEAVRTELQPIYSTEKNTEVLSQYTLAVYEVTGQGPPKQKAGFRISTL